MVKRYGVLQAFVLASLVACKPAAQTAMAAEPVTPSATVAVNAPLPAALNGSGSGAAAEVDDTEALIRLTAPKGIRESYFACIGAAQGTIARAECIASERDEQDARLNAIYKKLTVALDGNARTLMLSAQRAWLTFRSKDGELEDALLGDEQVSNLESSQDDVYRICRRANELERYLSLAKDG